MELVRHNEKENTLYINSKVGYCHPNKDEREFFRGFYYRMADAFHMKPESIKDMDERLEDGKDVCCHNT